MAVIPAMPARTPMSTPDHRIIRGISAPVASMLLTPFLASTTGTTIIPMELTTPAGTPQFRKSSNASHQSREDPMQTWAIPSIRSMHRNRYLRSTATLSPSFSNRDQKLTGFSPPPALDPPIISMQSRLKTLIIFPRPMVGNPPIR